MVEKYVKPMVSSVMQIQESTARLTSLAYEAKAAIPESEDVDLEVDLPMKCEAEVVALGSADEGLPVRGQAVVGSLWQAHMKTETTKAFAEECVRAVFTPAAAATMTGFPSEQ